MNLIQYITQADLKRKLFQGRTALGTMLRIGTTNMAK